MKRSTPVWPWALLVVGVLIVIVACVVVVPVYLVDYDVPGPAANRLTAKDLAGARNDVRTTLLQAIGGAFFIATAFFTWRQVRVSERQLRVSEDEQIASRFTKAIEQVGSDKADLRIGGIYALERIAQVSTRDHGPTVEVLTAFIRSRAPWPSATVGTSIPAPDVQAALTVLGRRSLEHEPDTRTSLNLSRVDLRGADMRGGMFANALLNNSNLDDADLRGIDLSSARLADASMRKARLRNAHLENAILVRAQLEEARLFRAQMQGAELIDAHLTDARLSEADLRKANFRGANLDNAYFGKANLEGALALDQTSHAGTTWPEGHPGASATP